MTSTMAWAPTKSSQPQDRRALGLAVPPNLFAAVDEVMVPALRPPLRVENAR
jgi:hypothetical protein